MKLIIILALISTSAYAENKAGVLFEPIFSYENTDFEVDYPSPLGNTNGELTGPGIGARVGFHIYETLLIGADIRYSKLNFNDKDNDFSSDTNAYNYGPTVILQLPTTLSLRVWGGYILGGKLDPKKSDGLDIKFEDASGYRVGAGVMVGTISLNLEYKDVTYGNSTLESVGRFNTNTSFKNVELNNSGYIASISFPFTP